MPTVLSLCCDTSVHSFRNGRAETLMWAGRVARAGLSRPHVDPLLYRDQHCTFNARLEQRLGPQTSFNWPPCDLVADGLVREGTRQRSVSNGLQDWQYQPVLVLQKAAD